MRAGTEEPRSTYRGAGNSATATHGVRTGRDRTVLGGGGAGNCGTSHARCEDERGDGGAGTPVSGVCVGPGSGVEGAR